MKFRSIMGSAAEWQAVLRRVDRGRAAMPQRNLNKLLDQVAHAIDSERDAALELLRRRLSRKQPRPGATP
jgi:hypothetical protein